MEDGLVLNHPLVNAAFRLGDETHAVPATKGTVLWEQLVSFKEESLGVLKEFITKHNAPAEVPDEALEGSGDVDDGEIQASSQEKEAALGCRKRKKTFSDGKSGVIYPSRLCIFPPAD